MLIVFLGECNAWYCWETRLLLSFLSRRDRIEETCAKIGFIGRSNSFLSSFTLSNHICWHFVSPTNSSSPSISHFNLCILLFFPGMLLHIHNSQYWITSKSKYSTCHSQTITWSIDPSFFPFSFLFFYIYSILIN